MLSLLLFTGQMAVAKDQEYPQIDHYVGDRFFNPGNVGQKSFGDFVRVLRERKKVPWPEWVENENNEKPPQTVSGAGIRLTYVNHATVLIQPMESILLLTPFGLSAAVR